METGCWGGGRLARCRNINPWNNMNYVFETETTPLSSVYVGAVDMIPQEKEMAKVLNKVIGALTVYHHATKDSQNWDFGPDGVLVIRKLPGAHYRRWHFRQLRNERYYRGEYANLPRGSRIVFVNEASVNAEREPA